MPIYYPSTGSGSGAGYSFIRWLGSLLTQRDTINFTGAGVSVTDTGTYTEVNIPGGGGGVGTWTEVEVDFGSTPRYDGRFTVVDATVSLASKVIVVPSGNTPTGLPGVEADWDNISFAAVAGSGSFTVYASPQPGPVSGRRKIYYQVG